MTVKCAAGTEGGPGSEPQFRTTLWLFFARVLLCWVALAFLPFSLVKGGNHYRPVRGELASVTRKGGRVWYWMYYDHRRLPGPHLPHLHGKQDGLGPERAIVPRQGALRHALVPLGVPAAPDDVLANPRAQA